MLIALSSLSRCTPETLNERMFVLGVDEVSAFDPPMVADSATETTNNNSDNLPSVQQLHPQGGTIGGAYSERSTCHHARRVPKVMILDQFDDRITSFH